MTAAPTVASSDELQLLTDSAQTFVVQNTDLKRLRTGREQAPGYDIQQVRQMAELGWFGIRMSEAQGGLGLGCAPMAAVLQALGRGLLAEPIVSSVVLAGGALSRGDNAALQARLLPQIVAGQRLPALAWQERRDGNDALGQAVCATMATAPAGPVAAALISGTKHFVSGGLDGFVVSAQGSDGLALYWVEPEAPGLQVQTAWRADGTALSTLHLQRTPAAAIVASPAIAADVLAHAIDEAAAMACAELCGLMGAAMDMTLEYLRTRVQFEKPIGSFQALQHRAVDLYVQQELALSALQDAVHALDDQRADAVEVSRAVSRAKSRCGDAGLRIARDAIQLHGAIGFTDDYDIGLYLKRAMVLASMLGTSEAHRRRYAVLAGAR